MTHPSKRKGNGFEREVVNAFTERMGWTAERAYASNGKALGKDETVDVLASNAESNVELSIQCKRRKSVASWLECNMHQDAIVFRADNKQSYIAMPLSAFLDLVQGIQK